MATSARTARIEIVPAVGSNKSSDPHFVRLRAQNGSILMTTENYPKKSNAKRAADSIVIAFFQAAAEEYKEMAQSDAHKKSA